MVHVRRTARAVLRPAGGALAALAAVAACTSPHDRGEDTGQAASAIVSVTQASGFECADGDLAPESTFDWNSFAPTTWTGSQPYRASTKTANGWTFDGIEDAQNLGTDSAFSGGVKQDDDCPSVTGAKAGNKEDLERIYLANKTDPNNGHVYLMLAWVRIPQNTTSSSAHIAFEFNQAQAPSGLCGGSSGKLVRRTAGDMLIVYDFGGGATDAPTINIHRWITSGTCDIGADSPPCWGTSQPLTSDVAEAKVDVSTVPPPVSDTIGPSGTEQLGLEELGEAGIDLTAAGVFPATPTTCTTFGTVFAVSRSSGNSGQAQMKDLVGPGNISITNCGTLTIKKVTSPSPDPTSTSFSFSLTSPTTQPKETGVPKSFSLKNGESNTTTVLGGTTYDVAEAVPANWQLTGASCDNNSGVLSGNIFGGISVLPGDKVTCTLTNTLQLGAIKVTKQSDKGAHPLANAQFTITDANDKTIATLSTDSSGTACVDNLSFGTYTVKETGAPAGYSIDDGSGVSVTVDHDASCTSGTPNAPPAFTDTPLSQIACSFTSLAGPGVTTATIQCTGDASASPLPQGTPDVLDKLPPGTYSCTVVVTEP